MTRTILLILSACIFTSCLLAQDTTYFNSSWRVSTAGNASYYRIKTKTSPGFRITDYYLSGKIQMTGSYADDSCHIAQGEWAWYNDKAVITHSCHYIQGKLSGSEVLFYDNGHKKIAGNNQAGEHEGEWLAYYPSGKLSAKARYEKGKQTAASFWYENGEANKTATLFMKEATYPGGLPQYLRFLNKNLRYPDSAVVHEIQGTVMVQFLVSKEGKISDLQVLESVGPYLDAEALRVMRLMKDWEPAIEGGIPTDSYHKQPVDFHLTD